MQEKVLKELEHLLVKKVLLWQRENTNLEHVMEEVLQSFFEGYKIHEGECKGFLERYIEMDTEGSYKGSGIPKAGRYGDAWNR